MTTSAEQIARSATTRRKPQIGGMQSGRPSQIDAPFDTRPDGTTRTISERFLEEIAKGLSEETASRRAGLKYATVREWFLVAARAEIRHTADPNTTFTPHEHQCRKFSQNYDIAAGQFEATFCDALDEIGRGGRRISAIRTKRRFNGPQDHTGHVVERIEETRVLPPDPQVLQWRLAARFPAKYGTKVQITNVDDHGLTPEDEAESLADALAAFLVGRDEGIAEAEATEQTAP